MRAQEAYRIDPEGGLTLKGRILVALAAAFALTAGPAYASAPITWTSLTPISPSGSPYAAGCAGSTSGVNYPGTEVEPWVATNGHNHGNSVAVWQQDRYSNGGANSLRAAYSAGGQWAASADQPAFTKCSGGTIPGVNNFERASDPWTAIASDGHVAYFMALVFNQSASLENGMTVSRSFADSDGVVGRHWEATPKVLKYDTDWNVLNDKNSLTADRNDPNKAYAIWDRLVFPNERSKGKSYENAGAYYGPTWFTRTTNGGNTWEPARKIWDPAQERNDSGRNDQSIGNQIVETGTGRLVDIFNWRNNDNGGGNKGGNRKGDKVAVITSDNDGQTWSPHATVIAHMFPLSPVDPETGQPIRSGDGIPEIAYDPRSNSQNVYAVWQAASSTSRSSVWFSESTDNGDSWSTPVVINTVPSVQAFTPSIRVDQNGRVVVTYYDFRNNDADRELWTDYWSIARDPGQTDWAESHISGPFDERTAPIARGFFLGDYAGLSAADDSDVFHAVFGQSNGTEATPSSDIEESDGD
jgi:hypothetical protein